jgi:hypothetical protein
MRKVIGSAFISLDGLVQAPGGPEEDTTGGFAHGGWIWPVSDTRKALIALTPAALEPGQLLPRGARAPRTRRRRRPTARADSPQTRSDRGRQHR